MSASTSKRRQYSECPAIRDRTVEVGVKKQVHEVEDENEYSPSSVMLDNSSLVTVVVAKARSAAQSSQDELMLRSGSDSVDKNGRTPMHDRKRCLLHFDTEWMEDVSSIGAGSGNGDADWGCELACSPAQAYCYANSRYCDWCNFDKSHLYLHAWRVVVVDDDDA